MIIRYNLAHTQKESIMSFIGSQEIITSRRAKLSFFFYEETKLFFFIEGTKLSLFPIKGRLNSIKNSKKLVHIIEK